MFEKKDVMQVKKDIETCVGQKVMLRSNIGRNKVEEIHGKLLETHPSVFVVQYDNSTRKASYSYQDVMIKTVEIAVEDNNKNYHSLFGNEDTNIF